MSHHKSLTLVPPKAPRTGLQKLAQQILTHRKSELLACRYCHTLRPANTMLRGSVYGDFCNANCRMKFWIATEW